jgi:hypothetical protein
MIENCKLCGSDRIVVVGGVAFSCKCSDCYKLKIQCCDSREEAIELWNKVNKPENNPANNFQVL